jgi:hypothetical protein
MRLTYAVVFGIRQAAGTTTRVQGAVAGPKPWAQPPGIAAIGAAADILTAAACAHSRFISASWV